MENDITEDKQLKKKKTMRELLAEKSKKAPHFLSIRKKPETFKSKVNKPRQIKGFLFQFFPISAFTDEYTEYECKKYRKEGSVDTVKNQ